MTAAALILVFGVSMNVGASRRLILRMWESAVDGMVSRTATNNVEEDKSIASTNQESLAAMEKIEEETGIPGIYFNYWPEGMEYLQYEIQDEGMEAIVFYSYGEAIIHLYMRTADAEASSYYLTDGDAVLIETIDTWKECEVEIWEINSGEGGEQYHVEFSFDNYRYILYGYMPLEELREFLNGMDFLS
ncbi:MAG: DUF4367 domain-containing protein [Lachnospiraceae bacterium]|nr:DUF4367 domain-containing protein [Lachnospiraceae bacterium]